MSNIVIIGAGIIGASTAYYLTTSSSKSNITITLLDQCPHASGASGKSGGFMARNWASKETASLADLSFRLHEQLAQEWGGFEKWGYRKAKAVSVAGKGSESSKEKDIDDLGRSVRMRSRVEVGGRGGEELGWLREGVVQESEELGDYDSIAQCDPYLLTTFLVDKAIENGAKLIQAKATQLTVSNNTISKVHAITSSGEQISLDCDALIIAAGPWTGELTRTLNLPNPIPITSYAGHSIILRLSADNFTPGNSTTSVSDSCLFMSLSISRNAYHPEIFPRPNGQIYICGINSDLPLPSTPLLAQPIPATISQLHSIADSLFGDKYVVEKEQVCFRPMTQHGEPFVGRVRGVNGVWVGAGHSFWGITLGPGTGLVLSEMVLGREGVSADVSGLRP